MAGQNLCESPRRPRSLLPSVRSILINTPIDRRMVQLLAVRPVLVHRPQSARRKTAVVATQAKIEIPLMAERAVMRTAMAVARDRRVQTLRSTTWLDLNARAIGRYRKKLEAGACLITCDTCNICSRRRVHSLSSCHRACRRIRQPRSRARMPRRRLRGSSNSHTNSRLESDFPING